MKKTLLVLAIALIAGLTSFAQITDTIVSLTPSNRNVLIEEYTGINCGYCPDGHKKANDIQAANPDRVNIINIHQGSYAANTYTTSFGNALANQIGLEGYPAGTVNRHIFPQYSSVLDVYRNYWAACANTIMSMSSPVNIAAEGTLDMTTRTLSLSVQLYYAGTQTVNSNMLNIAITQDNVLGSQAGASNFNPAQIVNGQYNHMHMLRHLITGQWGETITDIAQGTLVEKNYEYVIPDVLGSPNPIDAILEDLHFIAFVCEGHKEVLTSIEIPVQRVNYPAYAGLIMEINEVQNIECNDVAAASFNFKNIGTETVTSLTYTYSINGNNAQTASWNGSLATGQKTTVQIPDFSVQVSADNTLSVQITQINGVDVNSSPKTKTIKKNVYTGAGTMTFVLKTDNYGSETSFKIFDPSGVIVLSGGPFSNSSTIHEYAFVPTTVGCYRIEVYDQYGDGINCGYGVGYFLLKGEDGTQIFKDNGKFGSQATYMIEVTSLTGIEDITDENIVYPNPASDVIKINSPENVQCIEIFNMQGQLVKTVTGEVNHISVKDLANGMYTLKLMTDNGTSMHKIIKK